MAPRRNRVAPDSSLIATPARGLFFGNRGRLHRPDGAIPPGDRLRWAGRRWIICLTRYKDWRRPLAPPGGYTGLFFLDEATALAAGHRPCALCRRAAYDDFRRCAGLASIGADALDLKLHDERLAGRDRRLHAVAWPEVPVGAVVATLSGFALTLADRLALWSPFGYAEGPMRPKVGMAAVLSPPIALAALRTGYRAGLHPSADSSIFNRE